MLYMSPWEVVHTEKSSLFDADEEMVRVHSLNHIDKWEIGSD